MAGIGEGFTQGLELGSRIRDKRKDREMEQARMDLEARRDAERMAAEKDLQNLRLNHDAKMQMDNQAFTLTRDRGTQGFQSTESDKDRTWKAGESERDRTIARQNADTQRLSVDANALMGGKKLEYEMDPQSPENQLRTAQADYYGNKMDPTKYGRVSQPMDDGSTATFSMPVDELLKRASASGGALQAGPAKAAPPPAAIDALRKNPALKEQFRIKYSTDPEQYLR